jgi:peptidoglycan-associated lipoprotein
MRFQLESAVAKVVVTAALLTGSAAAHTSPASERVAELAAPRPELGLAYSFIHANAAPGSCDCFSLNGGSIFLAWPIHGSHLSIAADVTDTKASNLFASGTGINLSVYAIGAQYKLRWHRSRWQPFGQAMIGVAHAHGAVIQGAYSATSNANATLAAELGGGADLRLSRHFALRLVEVNYLLTAFDNSTNNSQNNLDLSAGIVFRFGRK